MEQFTATKVRKNVPSNVVYEVQSSTSKECGWCTIGIYKDLNEALNEYCNQLEVDTVEQWKGIETRVIDNKGNVYAHDNN